MDSEDKGDSNGGRCLFIMLICLNSFKMNLNSFKMSLLAVVHIKLWSQAVPQPPPRKNTESGSTTQPRVPAWSHLAGKVMTGRSGGSHWQPWGRDGQAKEHTGKAVPDQSYALS